MLLLHRSLLLCGLCGVLSGLGRAAVTEITVAQDHTLYDVRHQLAGSTRVAPGHTVSGTVETAPTPADKARVQVNTIEELGSGRYRFNLHANATASEGAYVLRFYDHSTTKTTSGCRPLPQTLTVYVKKVAVVAVSFRNGASGSLPVWTPGNPDVEHAGTAGEYEWINGAQNQSAAYVRNSGAKSVKVKLHGPKNTKATLSASGGFGGITQTSITFDANGEYYASNFPIANTPISATVDTNNIVWAWQAVISGQTSTMNSTTHKVFITANVSVTTNRPYWQLYQLGCNAGGTLAGIRGLFATRHIAIPAGDGEYMYYGCEVKMSV